MLENSSPACDSARHRPSWPAPARAPLRASLPACHLEGRRPWLPRVTLDVPDALLADLLRGRPGAVNRAAAYLDAVARLQAGLSLTAADLASAHGLGRNAGYELLQLARESAGSEAGVRRESAGTSNLQPTSAISQSPGVSRESAGSQPGARRESESARESSRESAGTAALPATSTTRQPAGVKRESAREPLAHAQLISDLTDLSLVDLENDQRPPAPSAPLFPALSAEPATAEGVELLRILRRWSLPPTLEAARWRVKPDEDLAWFTRDILPDAAGLDLCAVLRKWDNWLEGQHREKEAGRKSKFPKTWKNSLRQTLTFAASDRDRRPATGAHHAPTSPQRGSFGRTRQHFDIPVHTGHENAEEAMEFWRNASD